MGNTTSGEEGRHRLGYHVLRVKDDSPAYRAGIRPFFDYIVAINGVRLNTESTYLQDQMLANEDKPVMLDIYSTREQAGRRVEMIPTRKWGDGSGSLIGCSIRFCMFDAVNDVVWHILDVAHGSPAEKAGLCAHTDYVIGTPYGIMRGEGDLYDLVEDNIGEPLRLHVYNSELDHVREIVIIPNEEWGGDGLLGCDVGYGYLHRLPRQGSIIHRGSNGSPKRTPSLPYPPSQDMIPSNSYVRNTMPASFQPGEQPFDIVAPTPRPPHSPSWLNPSEVLEGSLQSKPNTITVDDEQDLPPLRFGRGERPDADDEPESEDELMPRRGRSVAYQEPTPNLSKPTSPTFLKQLQAVSLQDNSQTFTAHNTKPEIQTKVSVHHNSPQSETHSSAATHHGEHQYRYHQQPQQTPPQLPISTSKPISPTRLTDINSGDIPFGAGNSPDQFGVFSPPRQ